MLNMPENAIWQCFLHQLLKSTQETLIKAYAAFANVQHAEKRFLAVFPSSNFEIYCRKANNSIFSSHKC